MRKARIYLLDSLAGELSELEAGHRYRFDYMPDYNGTPVSLTMPTSQRFYEFGTFPPFFDGLLPEGVMLEALLREHKIDRSDSFGQLLVVGGDTVGAVTVEEIFENTPDGGV